MIDVLEKLIALVKLTELSMKMTEMSKLACRPGYVGLKTKAYLNRHINIQKRFLSDRVNSLLTSSASSSCGF